MKYLIALALAFNSMFAYAEFMTGNDLLKRMRDEKLVANAIALGYVMGASDAAQGSSHCGPSNLTAGQVLDMVKQFLENNPSDRHYSANSIVEYVLSEKWPCNNGGSGT